MNILVTGASGFVGRPLCRRLAVLGHDVFGLSASAPSSDLRSIFTEYYLHDLSEPFNLPETFDCVIHLAAYNVTHVGDTAADAYERVNVRGTQHLVTGVKTKRFIFLSTAKVYKNEGKPLTEDSPLAPAGAYERSKLEAEKICQTMVNEEDLVVLRSANIVGAGQALKAVVPVFFQKALRGEPLEIIVPRTTPMQFAAVPDVIAAFEAVLAHPQVHGTFNLASQEIITVEELARRIITLTRSSSALNVQDRPPVPAAPVIADKARRQLDWEAKISLDQLLQDYYTYGLAQT